MKSRELTLEEQEALTKDLTEVLEKHNADLGVIASIQILKRVEEETNGESNTKEETDSKTENSG